MRIIAMILILISLMCNYARADFDNSIEQNQLTKTEKKKIFVQDVRLVGIEPEYANIYSIMIAGTIRKLGAFDVITTNDLSELVGYENIKDVVACDSVSCLSDVGGLAIADFMVTSNISKFSDNVSLALTLSDVNSLKQVETVVEILNVTSPKVLNSMLLLQTELLFQQYLTKEEQELLHYKIENLKESTKPIDDVIGNKQRNVFDPNRLIKEKKTAISIGAIGGASMLSGGILIGLAYNKKEKIINNHLNDEELSNQAIAQKNIAVSGTTLLALGSAMAVTSLAIGLDYAVKNKKSKTVFIPVIENNGAFLSMTLAW